MFSGIIKEKQLIKKIDHKKGSTILTISKPKFKIEPGDSISTNGVCLTVKKVLKDYYQTELMPETVRKTTFGKNKQKYLNLEPSIKANERIHGHFVTGHIDTVGKLVNIKQDGQAKIYTFSFPAKFKKLVAKKGSIAVDGTSLTIMDVKSNNFSTSLVEYTLKNTNLENKKKNDFVNLEFDILAKYVKNYQ